MQISVKIAQSVTVLLGSILIVIVFALLVGATPIADMATVKGK